MNKGAKLDNPDQALVQAAQILESADDEVVGYIFELLNSQSTQANDSWDAKHNSSALGIISAHIKSLHHAKVIELEANERINKSKQMPILATIGFGGTLALSWLFLSFNHPEYLIAVLSGIFGFAGGYGVSNAKKGKS